MKIKIIQLLCVLVLFGCQKNDIDVFNGSDTNLAKLNGNWIVVNYWADWCAPCIKEIPELNEFAKENDDLLVFTFNFDFLEVDDLEPIAERFNIEVPSLITHPNAIKASNFFTFFDITCGISKTPGTKIIVVLNFFL